MGLRISKQTLVCFCMAAMSTASISADILAAEKEKYPVTYEQDVSDHEEPVMVLEEDAEDYTVLEGDSLWKIAQKLWGDGKYYLELASTNQDILVDPDLIYPGMVLKTSRTGYIIRKEAKYGGIQMVGYSMDMPYGWTTGITQSGEAFANFVMAGDGSIACLIQDKKKETLASVYDWKQCAQQITNYVKEYYSEQVSDLQFEHYLMDDQDGRSGNLYLYSFNWHISPEYPDLVAQVCVGLKLTEHVQAEFIGYAFDYDIHGGVRYVTASFEEYCDPGSTEEFTVNDSNMCIVPETEWEPEGIFNSFAYLDEFFTSKLERITGSDADKENQDPKERLINKMSRPVR